MPTLLAHAGLVNLIAAAIVLAGGLIIYFGAHPKVFRLHSYTKRAFEYWLLQWCAFVLIYIVLEAWPNASRVWVLASADLQSVLSFGFASAMLAGGNYRRERTLPTIIIVFAVLLLWNLGFGGPALQASPGATLRTIWILPSEIVSAGTLTFIAYVLVRRYGYPATSFAIAITAYVLLQRPAYTGLFVRPPESAEWMLALAFGKILYGSLLYSMFFLNARDYGHLELPTFGAKRPQVQGLLRWSLAVIWGMLTHFIAAFAAALLHGA